MSKPMPCAAYTHGRRLGVVTEADHRAVEKAREEATAVIEERTGPFAPAAGWWNWRSEPHWPSPSLPADTLTVGLP